MAEISTNEAKPDTTRGASAQVDANSFNQQGVDMGSQLNAKNASQSATDQFGAKSENIITLENDSVQSGASKNQNYSKIEVVQDSVALMEQNDIATVAVPDMSCSEVMAKMQSVLAAYNGEIDYSANEEKMEIHDGLVFIDGFYAVHFKIYTFTDEQTKATRWEFRRLAGTAMASGKFLGQIKAAFGAKDADKGPNQEEATSMEALPIDVDDMKMELSDEQKEMMMIHEALLSNEVGVELDEEAENYLTSKMVEVGAISKDAAVDHKLLVKALVDEKVLTHQDVAVQRAAIMILSKFAKDQGDAMKAAGVLKTLETVAKGAKFGCIAKRVEALKKQLASE